MQNELQTTPRAGNGPEDLLLVQAALRGEQTAVDVLLARLGCIPRFVFRLDRSLGCGLAADGLEDVVQQVYTVLWQRLGEFHGQNALETWVFVFCRNCLRSAARRALRQKGVPLSPELLSSMPARGASPSRGLERDETLALLADELDELPDAEREVVEARHLHGQSFEQQARTTGVAVSTIKDRCYRAMQRLQARVGRRMLGR